MRAKLYSQMFSQQKYPEIEQLAWDYSHQLLWTTQPRVIGTIETASGLGHDVAIVSASLDLYLQPIAQHLNMPLSSVQKLKNNRIF